VISRTRQKLEAQHSVMPAKSLGPRVRVTECLTVKGPNKTIRKVLGGYGHLNKTNFTDCWWKVSMPESKKKDRSGKVQAFAGWDGCTGARISTGALYLLWTSVCWASPSFRQWGAASQQVELSSSFSWFCC
jgi:hypothetical protein